MKLTEGQRKKRPCAACGKRVGNATIVAGGKYPDAPLCAACFYVEDIEAKIEARAKVKP